MIDLQRTAAVAAARGVAALSRTLSLGGGTAMPGIVAARLDPGIVDKLARELRAGMVVVTGTNGKTTVTKMLVEALQAGGLSVVTNESGSNLMRGVASALVTGARIGAPRPIADVGVLEVDELSFPQVARAIRPDLVVVTNFMRDQLDRSGEVDRVVASVRAALEELEDPTVVLNADDPLSASLAESSHGRTLFFGVETDPTVATPGDIATEGATCPRCGEPLSYAGRTFGHLGAWHCTSCANRRPEPTVRAQNVLLRALSSSYVLEAAGARRAVTLAVPSLYNVYNSLAAAAAARALLVMPDAVAKALRGFSGAFGRTEALEIDGRRVMILLAKNPVGATQALDAAFRSGPAPRLGFVLNDREADGRDVSWTWDVALESFDLSRCHVVVSGSRATDMAVRLKYAGVPPERIAIVPDPAEGARALAAATPADGMAFLLPTYTAMLEIRNRLAPRDDGPSRLGRLARFGRSVRLAIGGA